LETCVTVFLVKEEIHTLDVHAYKNACMGATSVSILKMDTDIADQPHSGTCKLHLLKPGANQWGSSERIKVKEMTAEIGIGHCALQQKVQSLEYQEVSALWVPHLLIEKHKFQRGGKKLPYNCGKVCC